MRLVKQKGPSNEDGFTRVRVEGCMAVLQQVALQIYALTIRQPIGVAGLINAANTPIVNVDWKIFPRIDMWDYCNS